MNRFSQNVLVGVVCPLFSRQIYAKTGRTQKDKRVPFIVKLPGMSDGHTYAGRFNTVILKDMVLAYFRGEISDNQSLSTWLDKHGKPVTPVISKAALGND